MIKVDSVWTGRNDSWKHSVDIEDCIECTVKNNPEITLWVEKETKYIIAPKDTPITLVTSDAKATTTQFRSLQEQQYWFVIRFRQGYTDNNGIIRLKKDEAFKTARLALGMILGKTRGLTQLVDKSTGKPVKL